jgi:hypothetical protein
MLDLIGPIWSSSSHREGEAREHEAAVFADARHAGEAECFLPEIRGASLRHRDAQQRAVGVVTPAVIEAGQAPSVAAALVDDLGAAVGAAVEEDMHAAVAVAGHDYRRRPSSVVK